MNKRTNTYLPNGHNYQDPRLRIYLPGNGGLLTAIALMCAGWDGCEVEILVSRKMEMECNVGRIVAYALN